MAHKQQMLINLLNKYVRQYFVFERQDKQKEAERPPKTKVLLRNEVHCVEAATSGQARSEQLKQRLLDNQLGQMTPQYTPFDPVSGWPVLRLEELVLNTLEKHLDSKVWQALKSHFEKEEVKRVVERKDLGEALKDLSVVFKCQTAGFNRIRAHMAETEARMHVVKAGFDFQQHLTRTVRERHRREAPKQGGVQKFSADPDAVKTMQRVRNDTVKFLVTVENILEKLMLLRLRHLRSHVPIPLQYLGTEKDRVSERHTDRILQYPGGPPVVFNFREQIISEAPPGWPLMSKYAQAKRAGRGPGYDHFSSFQSRPSFASRSLLSEDTRSNKRSGSPMASQSTCSLPLADRDDHGPLMTSRVFQDKEMLDAFRKRWPPVWMSLAAFDQGFKIVDPQCPSREYYNYNQNTALPRKKSLSDILATRDDWATLRQNLDKSVLETLWREDKERLGFFHKQYASLAFLPLSKPYPTHERHMNHLLAQTRTKRQEESIYDCELSNWYKYLVIKVNQIVGKDDEEINQLLEKVKHHFKMPPTSPRYGKAKLALITMSLPAHVVTQIHVQRALRFILCQVFQAPEAMLMGWLAIRGLPFVLLPSHVL